MVNQEIAWLLKEKYGGVESEAFHADCARLNAGEPLGYVIGHVPFLGSNIYLDSHPLIPRPETEFWTEKAIQVIREAGAAKPRPLNLLDLCAGSGAIGVAVAHHVPGAVVHFAELDPAHLPTIAKNLSENQIACTKYRVWQSDLFNGVPDELFDFILTNPPYIDPELDRAEASVKDFEPHLALYGGDDGMELIERIIAGARAKLAPRGELWLEHEPEQTAAIAALAAEHSFAITTYPDQYGTERYSVLVLQ